MSEDPTFIEQLIPWIPALSGLAIAALAGGFAVWNRRRGAVETRAPDVTEMWAQTERARSMWRFFEDLYYETRGAFRGYVRRVQAGGSTELTEAEKRAHESNPDQEKP